MKIIHKAKNLKKLKLDYGQNGLVFPAINLEKWKVNFEKDQWIEWYYNKEI